MPDPNQIPNPYGQIAQPQQGGGLLDSIGHILSHPAVQGLLGAYFGAVSSPRNMGWGGAIGRGGLMGLETYGLGEQVRSEQQKQALEQQKYQTQQQAIGQLPSSVQPFARAGVDPKIGMELETQKQGLAANQQTAAAMVQFANQQTDPAKKARYNFLASSIAQSPKPVDGNKIMEAMGRDDLNTIHAELYKQQIPEAQARTQEALAGVGEKQASAQRSLAEAGAVGPRLGLEQKRVDLEGQRLAAQAGPQKAQQERAKAFSAAYNKAMTDYVKAHPQHLMGLVGGGTPEEAAQYATNQANAAVAAFSAPSTETAGAPTPYSGTPVSDPNIPPPPPGFKVH